MPECHKCVHNGKGSEACWTCKGPAETNHKGRSHVSIDAGGAQTLGLVQASVTIRGGHDDTVSEDARHLLAALLGLLPEEFLLIKRLLAGRSMADIAREDGLTRAAISDQVRKLVEQHPEFYFLRGKKQRIARQRVVKKQVVGTVFFL